MRTRLFDALCWTLVAAMAIYVLLIVVPGAKAGTPPSADLLVEIEGADLRVFEYETASLICHVAIMEVRMIGAQAAVTCVLKRPLPKTEQIPDKD